MKSMKILIPEKPNEFDMFDQTHDASLSSFSRLMKKYVANYPCLLYTDIIPSSFYRFQCYSLDIRIPASLLSEISIVDFVAMVSLLDKMRLLNSYGNVTRIRGCRRFVTNIFYRDRLLLVVWRSENLRSFPCRRDFAADSTCGYDIVYVFF